MDKYYFLYLYTEFKNRIQLYSLKTNRMKESDCCGALPLWDTDICSDCGEHAEFNDTDKDLI